MTPITWYPYQIMTHKHRSHDTHVSILSWAVRFCRMISTTSRCFFMCSSMKADWSEPRWPIRLLVMSSLPICSRSRAKQLLLCFFICSTLSYRRKYMPEILIRSSKIDAPSVLYTQRCRKQKSDSPALLDVTVWISLVTTCRCILGVWFNTC